MRRLARPAVLLLAVLLTACTTPRVRDLPGAVASTGPMPAVPVIVIPGVLGSRLAERDTGREVWPGSTRQLLTSRYRHLALPIDPDTLEPLDDGLVATELFDRAAGQDFYRRILRKLQSDGGYQPGIPGEPVTGGPARLYTFAYDWRQDNVVTVRALDALIAQIRRDHGNQALPVDIIAHSMGGLIVRYYQRFGTVDLLDGEVFPVTGAGAANLRRVVLLGTPGRGSVGAIHLFLTGYQLGLSRLPPEVIATMPSMYQLFPHPSSTWVTAGDGTPLARDPFDVGLWRQLEWSVFGQALRQHIADEPGTLPGLDTFERYFVQRLQRARRFTQALLAPAGTAPLGVSLVAGSNCVPTPARLVIEQLGGESVTRLWPRQVARRTPGIDYRRLMYDFGDGRVTAASLLGQPEPEPFADAVVNRAASPDDTYLYCELHDSLAGNRHFLARLLRYLLVEPEPRR